MEVVDAVRVNDVAGLNLSLSPALQGAGLYKLLSRSSSNSLPRASL
jgi:hypothetical protein